MAEYLKHSDDGWYVVLNDKGLKEPLPEYLKVHMIRTQDNRDYFQVLEGLNFGKTFSIARRNGISYIEKGTIHKALAELTFNIKTENLEIKGLGTFKAITYLDNPVPLGNYDIEIPDAPHGLGSGYLGNAEYALTWFRVGNAGDRYLHCGSFSAGCITVKDVDKWDKIYEHLIISRKNNQSVGTVEVVDQ